MPLPREKLLPDSRDALVSRMEPLREPSDLTMENLNVALRIKSMPSMESQFHHADMLLERMELKWLNQKHQTQMWKTDPLLLQLNTLS